MFALHDIDAEILSASIRNPLHVTQSALAGAHIATLPFKILQQMVHHPLTDKGIVTFRQDWEKARAAVAAQGGPDAKVAAELAPSGNGAQPARAATPAAKTGGKSASGRGSGRRSSAS
jgi:hypothetical protein